MGRRFCKIWRCLAAALLVCCTLLFQTGLGTALEIAACADSCCASEGGRETPDCPPACQECVSCGVAAIAPAMPWEIQAILAQPVVTAGFDAVADALPQAEPQPLFRPPRPV